MTFVEEVACFKSKFDRSSHDVVGAVSDFAKTCNFEFFFVLHLIFTTFIPQIELLEIIFHEFWYLDVALIN